MKKIVRLTAFIPMIFMMCVIWGFSSNIGEVSSGQSQGIVSFIIDSAQDITRTNLSRDEQQVWEERIHTPIRKMAHVTEYMIFSLTVAFPLLQYMSSRKKIRRITFLFCIFYASLDELHQLFVPERSGQIRDVLIDGIGVSVGIFLFSLINKSILKHNKCNSSAGG